MQKKITIYSLTISGFIGIVSIYFYRIIFLGLVPFWGDLMLAVYPWRYFISQEIKKGLMPLWNPLVLSGIPLMGNPSSAYFYPLNIIFYLFPTWRGLGYSLVIHFFLAGLFMYCYMKKIGFRRGASFVSALVFMLSGYFIGHFAQLTMVNAAVWLPLIFLFWEMIFRSKSILWRGMAVLSIAFQIHAGHPQSSFFILGAFFVYALLKKINNETRVKRLVMFLMVVGSGIMLSAVLLFPTYEFTQYFDRSTGLNYSSATLFSLPIKHLITLLLPNFFGSPQNGNYIGAGNYGELCGYMGVLGLLLGLIGSLAAIKKKNYRLFLGAACFSLILALGNHTFFYKLYYYLIPGAKYFRVPARFLLLYVFFWSVLIGLGFNYLTGLIKTKKSKVILKLVIIVIIFFDLTIFGIKALPLTEAGVYYFKTPSMDILGKDEGIWRFSRHKNFETIIYRFISYRDYGTTKLLFLLRFKNSLVCNMGMLGNFQYSHGFEPLVIYDSDVFLTIATKNFYFDPKSRKMLDMLNIKYILSFDEINDKDLNLCFDEKTVGFKVYKNNSCLPRMWAVQNFLYMPNKKDILKKIEEDSFNPIDTVILEEEPSATFLCNDDGEINLEESSVRIVDYLSQRVIVKAEMLYPGFLVFSDNFYPGWKAYINGKQSKIYKANYAFRALPLNRGKHTIDFIYEPLSYRIGLWITLVSLCGVLWMLFRKAYFLYRK